MFTSITIMPAMRPAPWNLSKSCLMMQPPNEPLISQNRFREICEISGCVFRDPLGDIARAKGMSQVARDADLSRESLYKALSGERIPSFDTILKIVAALGLKLHAETAR